MVAGPLGLAAQDSGLELTDMRRFREKPEMQARTLPVIPEEAVPLGHMGDVVIRFSLDAEGKVLGFALQETSGSEILDSAALELAPRAVWSPAADRRGRAVPAVVEYRYRYESWAHTGGLTQYSCAQFTLENDWWDATFPARDGARKRPPLFRELGVYRIMQRVQSGNLDLDPAFNQGDAAWDVAREQCRANPDKRFVDYIDLGPQLERAAQGG